MMIEIVSATRMTQGDFWNKSPLGLSLKRLANDTRLAPYIVYENQRGLPEVFNERITAQTRYEILVFVHDDVWIDDYFLADRVIEGHSMTECEASLRMPWRWQMKTYDCLMVTNFS